MSIFAIGNGKANGELGTGSYEEKLDPVMLETIKGKTVVELKACESNAVAITGTSPLPLNLLEYPRVYDFSTLMILLIDEEG